MARKPRNTLRPGLLHVYGRGNNGQVIFREDGDRLRYLALLGQTVTEYGWRCLAYCLMPNHIHLLVEVEEIGDLSAGMQWLHGQYAQRFNQLHRVRGHLFEDRFGAVQQETDAQLRHTARYIVVNPVKPGLCQHPEDWRWSSHRAIVTDTAPAWLHRDRLLHCFSDQEIGALRRDDRFIRAHPTNVLRMAA